MRELSATEAARDWFAILDAVEHRGEMFVVTRNGKPVARITPVSKPNGRAVKELLLRLKPDPAWAEENRQLREMLQPQGADWPEGSA